MIITNVVDGLWCCPGKYCSSSSGFGLANRCDSNRCDSHRTGGLRELPFFYEVTIWRLDIYLILSFQNGACF